MTAPAPIGPDADARAGAYLVRLYERHARALYGLCVMLLADRDEAEDALQSTFLAAYGALRRGAAPRDESAWLVAIARNECRHRIRRRMETPVHADVTAIEGVPAREPAADERIADPRVRKALSALSASQREAVFLHDVLGLRSREVAAVLGISRPAVEALLFRARRQLRLRLRPVGILVVPAAVGHALAQVIPGFVAPAAAAGSVGSGVGIGVLAKLAAQPTVAKVAAGVTVAATAGSVTAVEVSRRPAPSARHGTTQSARPASAETEPVSPSRTSAPRLVARTAVEGHEAAVGQADGRGAEPAGHGGGNRRPGGSEEAGKAASADEGVTEHRGGSSGSEDGHHSGHDGAAAESTVASASSTPVAEAGSSSGPGSARRGSSSGPGPGGGSGEVSGGSSGRDSPVSSGPESSGSSAPDSPNSGPSSVGSSGSPSSGPSGGDPSETSATETSGGGADSGDSSGGSTTGSSGSSGDGPGQTGE